jgi:hypothetical protein
MQSEVDHQIARSTEVLERARDRHRGGAQRVKRRREAEVLRRVGRIAVADLAILIGALVVGWFVPLGIGGAVLVMALLIAATALFAIFPVVQAATPETFATAPLKALPQQTERWLETQRPALPAPARTLTDSIGVRLDTLSLQLGALDEREPAAAEVRKLVGEQLPELVRGYQRVPEPLRRVERNGRTPDEQLVEGLKVIDEEIADMSRQLAQGDLDSLATRNRYLQIKYRDDETLA